MDDLKGKKRFTICGVNALKAPPPVIAFFFLFAGWGLDLLFPSPEAWRFESPGVGLFLVFLGLTPILWTLWTFFIKKTTLYPRGKASVLVCQGPFCFSRNPVYLGAAVLLLGIALIWGTAPMLLAPAGFFLTMNSVFIPFEEQHLRSLFGDDYDAYKKRVRRWL